MLPLESKTGRSHLRPTPAGRKKSQMDNNIMPFRRLEPKCTQRAVLSLGSLLLYLQVIRGLPVLYFWRHRHFGFAM